MKAFAGLCGLLAACGFEHGARPGNGPDDGGIDGLVDSGPDAMPDAFDPNCFGKAPFSLCLAALPTQPVLINTNIDSTADQDPATCDSGRGVVMVVGGTSSCVIAATNITFSGTITGSSGTKPIVLVATGSITLTSTQTLDARSASTGNGPGANPTDCVTAPTGVTSANGGGGGGGGSFGSRGGDGADGGGGAGGVALAAVATPVVKLRGGCRGGDGAPGTFSAPGGAGGGAVYFLARQTIQIDGTVTASGAGGVGGQSSKGGAGGGGSGGMILLHGGVISIGTNARLFANGGGGGAGAGNGTDGASGNDATMMTTGAAGGPAGGGGTTTGGNGAFRTTPAQSPADSGNGGGGGGGGLGVIRVLSGQTTNPNNFSPAASS